MADGYKLKKQSLPLNLQQLDLQSRVCACTDMVSFPTTTSLGIVTTLPSVYGSIRSLPDVTRTDS